MPGYIHAASNLGQHAAFRSASAAASASGGDLSVAAATIIGENTDKSYGTKHREALLQCYTTGEFPFHVWLAAWKGTCVSCWRPYRKLSPVTRHAFVSGLVVNAACEHGALPSCVGFGEEATEGASFRRKMRNQQVVRLIPLDSG